MATVISGIALYSISHAEHMHIDLNIKHGMKEEDVQQQTGLLSHVTNVAKRV